NLTPITLPKLGESISEATVLNWLVNEGDRVEKDQTILEVATDKVDSEIPAPANGILTTIIAQPEEVIKVGAVLGEINPSADQSVPKKTVKSKPATESKPRVPNPMPVKTSTAKPAQPTNSGETISLASSRAESGRFYSPLVYEIARQERISDEELARIPASGRDGRLRKSDIFRYIENGRPARYVQTVAAPTSEATGYQIPNLTFDKGKGHLVEMNRMGKMIADHMIYSKVNSPHVTAYSEADLTDLVAWRNAHKQAFQGKYGCKLTFTPLFIRAIALALKDFPRINSSFDGTHIIEKEAINIGMGAALPDGNLIVPVIKNADQKDLPTLAKAVNELAVKAREN